MAIGIKLGVGISGVGGAGGAPNLLSGLVAYWALDEASGTRADSVDGHDLSDNNTVTQAAGLVHANAASFARATSEYLEAADHAAMSGDIPFTLAVWFYQTTAADGQTRTLVSRDDGFAGLREWNLRNREDPPEPAFEVRGANTILSGTPLALNAWHLAVVWHDPVANEIGMQLDGGSVLTEPTTGAITDRAVTTWIGGRHNSGSGGQDFFDGRIGPAAYWGRVLSAAERALYYNGGAGLAYPFAVGLLYLANGFALDLIGGGFLRLIG